MGRSFPNMALAEAASEKLVSEIQSARVQSDRLFQVLKPDALYERPIAERHRVIFYVGHLDGFDAIQIAREGAGNKSSDSTLAALLQAGIDPDAAHLPSDSPKDWPAQEQVLMYVQRCRQRVDEAIDRCPEEILLMALEHRLMHLETLAYMFHNFRFDQKQCLRDEPSTTLSSNARPHNDWLEIPEGEAALGLPDDGRFGWDNEFGQVRRAVPA